MRYIRLVAFALLPWLTPGAVQAQGLQPESKQEFQRVFGQSAGSLTCPSLTNTAAGTIPMKPKDLGR
jgi:hypothetical protein